MRNLWLVAQREFVMRGKSAAYLITTALIMVMLLFTTIFPAIMQGKSKTQALDVMVLDQTGMVTEGLKSVVATAAQGQARARSITVNAVSGDEASLTERAKNEGKVLLVITGSFPDDVKARYLAGDLNMLDGANAVMGPLESMVRAARISKAGLDPKVAAEILKPMSTEVSQITASGKQRNQDAFMGAYLLSMGVVMALYMVILMNGQFVFMGVLEEKLSRVMEVMVSNVSASAMMAGKVLGLAALGLLQFIGTILAWFVGNEIAAKIAGTQVGHLSLGTGLLAFLFLILGFIMVSTLMAAGAATISRMEDQQTVMTPITLLVALPLLCMTAFINNPDSTLAVVLSIVPFFSQSLMIFRVLMGGVPVWQILLSLFLMVIATIGFTWASGRVYRAAMLSYGGRPTMKKLWEYLKAG